MADNDRRNPTPVMCDMGQHSREMQMGGPIKAPGAQALPKEGRQSVSAQQR